MSPPIKLTFTPCGYVTQSGSEKSNKRPVQPRPILKELGLDNEGLLLLRGLTGQEGKQSQADWGKRMPLPLKAGIFLSGGISRP